MLFFHSYYYSTYLYPTQIQFKIRPHLPTLVIYKNYNWDLKCIDVIQNHIPQIELICSNWLIRWTKSALCSQMFIFNTTAEKLLSRKIPFIMEPLMSPSAMSLGSMMHLEIKVTSKSIHVIQLYLFGTEEFSLRPNFPVFHLNGIVNDFVQCA